jgi:CRISPR-associated protein Cas5d
MAAETHVLEVWGEFACFTRPELKVERFSYPVITPSAARGIFDAIYCKPVEFRWQITRVEILNPVQYIALRRNEMKGKLAESTVLKWARGADPKPMWADGDEEGSGRTQRQTMALKDVRYRLHAHMIPWGHSITEGKINSEFRRRANAGKCFAQPGFGLREFPAYFELAAEIGTRPIPWDADLGWMLYDVFDLSRPGSNLDAPSVSIFRAQVKGGSMEVPPFSSSAVRKVEGVAT